MRSFLRTVVLALLVALVALASPALAAVAARQVPIVDFHPTQMEIGRAAVDFHIDKWKHEAEHEGMSLADYAERILKPAFAATTIDAVIDPDGLIRNTDGHHRISALRKLTKRTGVRFSMKAEVLADYRGWTQQAYADHFINKLGKGQFTAAVEALPVGERIKHLPATFPELKNNPLRSSVEVVFSKHGIEGRLMRNYVEFRAVRRLLDRGLLDELKEKGIVPERAHSVRAQLATDPRLIKVIEKRLAKPKMRRYLLSEAIDGRARATLKQRLGKLRR